MRLGGTARYACTITSEEDLLTAVDWASKNHLPLRVIGIGSNIIWRDEGYPGLLIINKIEGCEILDDGVGVVLGAGTNWDSAVEWSVNSGLSGIESLSLIPGTVGATPVQNVGAYGNEIKDVFVSLRAYDMHQKSFVTLDKESCDFGYRTSRFKTTDSGRFIITSVTLALRLEPPKAPFYDSLQVYLNQKSIHTYSTQIIRDAVIAIRSSKLPDPAKIANNGSFFANPIVSVAQYNILKKEFDSIKGWPVGEHMIKIAAAWLIENAGFGDFHDKETGMATWHSQSLVLINEHARNTADLLTFKQKVVTAVHQKFGILLEQEPELLP